MYAEGMYVVCMLYVCCLYVAGMLQHIRCMHVACSLHVRCMYVACSLHVRCVYFACSFRQVQTQNEALVSMCSGRATRSNMYQFLRILPTETTKETTTSHKTKWRSNTKRERDPRAATIAAPSNKAKSKPYLDESQNEAY